MTAGPGLRVGITVGVAPTVVAGTALLARSAVELVDDLRAAADENPALLVEERTVCPWCGRGAPGGGRCRSCATPARPRWPGPPVDPGDLATPVSEWEQLRADAVSAAAPALGPLVHAVLDAVDDRGLLSPEHHTTLLRHGVAPAALAAAVAAVRSAGPPGFAASDPRESLLLQLDTSPLDPAERVLARRILTGQAERLAADGPAAVAAELGVGAVAVTAVLARMRRVLRPFPVPDDDAARPAPPPPDLVFVVDGPAVRAELTERARLRVRIDPAWCDSGDPRDRARLAAARELVAHVDRRWSLLDRIGALLAERHADELRAHSEGFGRLTQADAAGRLGVHPSTVSRAVRHRTARLPGGRVVPLRRLFGAHHDTAAAVAELVTSVPRPSDRAVAEALGRRGIRIARRTVTKYRLALAGPA